MQALFRVVDRAASLFGAIGGFAPYLVEEHHQLKRDAPSGTALRLAQSLVERTPGKTRWDVAPTGAPLPPEVVSVAWVRAGEIPGPTASAGTGRARRSRSCTGRATGRSSRTARCAPRSGSSPSRDRGRWTR